MDRICDHILSLKQHLLVRIEYVRDRGWLSSPGIPSPLPLCSSIDMKVRGVQRLFITMVKFTHVIHDMYESNKNQR